MLPCVTPLLPVTVTGHSHSHSHHLSADVTESQKPLWTPFIG